MDYIFGTDNFLCDNSSVTIGKFDGVHLGHRKLLNELLREKNTKSVVFSFDMYPATLFAGSEKKMIYTQREKKIILEDANVDIMWAYPFTKDTADMMPETFVKEILVKKLGVKKLVVGTDFCFGKNRSGNIEVLKELAKKYGFDFEAVEKEMYAGSEISSTRIRKEIEMGNMEDANIMLGEPFGIFGEVVHGKALGRNIGIPTINIIPESAKLLPPNGVYASITEIDGKKYHGMTNIGCRPTVEEGSFMNAETHLFDCSMDLYGKFAKVCLYKFTRPESKFDSIESLKERLYKDREEIKTYFQSSFNSDKGI